MQQPPVGYWRTLRAHTRLRAPTATPRVSPLPPAPAHACVPAPIVHMPVPAPNRAVPAVVHPRYAFMQVDLGPDHIEPMRQFYRREEGIIRHNVVRLAEIPGVEVRCSRTAVEQQRWC